jgi:hypothetical protein
VICSGTSRISLSVAWDKLSCVFESYRTGDIGTESRRYQIEHIPAVLRRITLVRGVQIQVGVILLLERNWSILSRSVCPNF